MKEVGYMDGMVEGFYFCSNPERLNGLHVRAGAPGEDDDGNCAEIAGGILGAGLSMAFISATVMLERLSRERSKWKSSGTEMS
jgi:hypothetical protein